MFQLSKIAGRSAAALDDGSGMNSANSSKQGTLKEESSDESTIVSSSQVQFKSQWHPKVSRYLIQIVMNLNQSLSFQASTLTRNVGPEAMLQAMAQGGVAAPGFGIAHEEFEVKCNDYLM